MDRSFKKSLMFILVILALVVSAVGVTPAFADDETPPAPPTEESVQPSAEQSEGPVTSETIVQEAVATETPVTAQPEGIEAPAIGEAVETEEPMVPELTVTEEPAVIEILDDPTTSETVPDSPEEFANVDEVLEQVPADTPVVVLDEDGQVEPLATQEAAEIVQSGDPMWCPEGVTPGGPGCTSGFTSLESLLYYLAVDTNEPAQAGVIWIQSNYVSSANDPGAIGFDLSGGAGGMFNTMSQYDLTIQGGWSGGSNVAVDHTNPSVFSGDWLIVWDWGGNVTINDIQIVSVSSNQAMVVAADGNVSLDHVVIDNNYAGGAQINASGNVDVTNSTFSNSIEVDPLGTFYGDNGLYVNSGGSVTLDNVTANENDGDGAQIYAAGSINVSNSTFNNNTGSYFNPSWGSFKGYVGGTGLTAYSNNGSVTLNNVSASGNSWGAVVDASSDVNVANSTFNDNSGGFYFGSNMAPGYIGGSGLEASSLNGNIFITNSTFNGNSSNPGSTGDGAYLDTAGGVFVTCSVFQGNDDYGINATWVDGPLTLGSVTFAGNVTSDYQYNGDATIMDVACSPFSNSGGDNGTSSDAALYYITEQTQDQIPALLGSGNVFVSALQVILTPEGEKSTNLLIQLSFVIPEGTQIDKLAVLWWNGKEWEPISGGSVVGNYFVITVSRPGYYVLVSP